MNTKFSSIVVVLALPAIAAADAYNYALPGILAGAREQEKSAQ